MKKTVDEKISDFLNIDNGIIEISEEDFYTEEKPKQEVVHSSK